MFNKIFTLIINSLIIILTSCSSPEPLTYLVFVDYSISASTLESNNKEKFLANLGKTWNSMIPNEELIIYPIHLLSETATPLFKTQKPIPNGDLNDRLNSKSSSTKFIELLGKKVFDEPSISHDVRMGTNIYPILRKIKRFQDNTNVSVYIVRDMNHEYLDEQLNKTFSSYNSPDPYTHAEHKIDSLGLRSSLNRSDITIAIPGSYRGDVNDELTRASIIEYWENLFMLTGSSVKVVDL